MPSPPVSVSSLPPARCLARSARVVVERRRTLGRSSATVDPSVRRASRAQRLHVPDVVAVGVDPALARQQMKRRDLEVVDRRAPASSSGGRRRRYARYALAARAIAGRQHRVRPRSALCSAASSAATASAERAAPRPQADGRILACAAAPGLGRPRHQLGVEAQPVGRQFVPESGARRSPPAIRSSTRLQVAASLKNGRPCGCRSRHEPSPATPKRVAAAASSRAQRRRPRASPCASPSQTTRSTPSLR